MNREHRQLSLFTGAMLGAAASAIVLSLLGCGVKPSGYDTFIAASHEAAFTTIGPTYRAYVENDDSLSVDIRESRILELMQWQGAVEVQMNQGEE